MKLKSKLRPLHYIACGSLFAINLTSAQSTSATWDENNAGDWTTVTNWVGNASYAEGADNTATFGNSITLDRIVTLNTGITIGNITASDTSHNYTISGANILTLDRTTGVPNISVTTAARILTISSQISGSDGLQKSGAGTLTLSGTNNYTGGTTISAGTLIANADANLGASTGGITFSGNGSLQMTGTITHNRQITLDSGVTGTIVSGAGINYNNSAKVTGAGNLRFTQTGNGGRNLRFNSTANDFTGTVSVENTSGQQLAVFFNSLVDSASSGAGNIILTMSSANGPNTFSYGSGAVAPLTLTNRRLELPNTSTVNPIFSNQNTTHAVTINSNLLISGTGNKGLTLDAVAGPNNEFAGEIDNGSVSAATQVVSIHKTGAGNWALSSTGNDFTGTISLNAGTLSYASAGGANPISFTNTSGAATLTYTGATDKTMSSAINGSTVTSGTINLLSTGAGAVNYSNTASLGSAGSGIRNLVLGGSNEGNNILAGRWVNNTSGNATVTKNGTGTWILSNTNNTYSGATTVSAGKLLVNGTTTVSAFSVANGATLGGAGTVGGTVALSGNLAPGDGTTAAGTLTTGTTTWNNTGIFNFDLGATSDMLTVSGIFTKGTNSAGDGKFTFNFSGSPTVHTPITVIGFSSTTFSLADFNATGIAGSFTLNPTSLQFTPVPEASNVLIGGLLGLGLMSRRRKNA